VSTRRTIAAIALAATAPFALSACGTSFGAQTNQQYQAGVGANLREGPLKVYNGLFVDNGDGTLTFSGGLLAGEEQTIESVSIDGAAKRLPAPIEVAPNALLTLGTEGEIIVRSRDIEAGDYVTISFAATPGGDVSVRVPVVERTETYEGVAEKAGAGQAPQESETDPAEPETGQDAQDQQDTSPPSS